MAMSDVLLLFNIVYQSKPKIKHIQEASAQNFIQAL